MRGNGMSDKPGLLVVGELPDWDFSELAARFTLHHYWSAPDKAAMLAAGRDSIVAICTKGEIGADAALMDALPHTQIIACYGVGVDAIDLDAARARGIRVTNTPDVLTEEVADMAMMLMLAAARNLRLGEAWVRDGSWQAKGAMPLTTRIWGKRLGIVGLGRIGKAIAKRAEAFGMSIAYSGRAPQPGLPYTHYPTPAALAPHVDVFLNEPAIDPAFLTFPNVVLQPHAASGTVETRKDMGRLMRANLEAQIDGRPLLTALV